MPYKSPSVFLNAFYFHMWLDLDWQDMSLLLLKVRDLLTEWHSDRYWKSESAFFPKNVMTGSVEVQLKIRIKLMNICDDNKKLLKLLKFKTEKVNGPVFEYFLIFGKTEANLYAKNKVHTALLFSNKTSNRYIFFIHGKSPKI